MRYRAFRETTEGEELVVLTDEGTDSEIRILPSIGFNLFYCRLKGREIVEPPPGLAGYGPRMSEYGSPLLVPPSRIPGGGFDWNGRRYQLPINENGVNHVHGEARELPWEVTAMSADDREGAAVTAEFRFAGFAHIPAYYPHSVIVRLTYRLAEGKLKASCEAINGGDDEAPFAFGLHPYFSLGDAGEDAVLTVPAALQYDTSHNGFIRGEPEATSLCERLSEGMPVSQLTSEPWYYWMFRLSDKGRSCSLVRRKTGARVTFSFSDSLPYLVLYKPDWSHSVAIEPWSCINDAYNIPLPQSLTGASGLAAGESAVYGWEWTVEESGES